MVKTKIKRIITKEYKNLCREQKSLYVKNLRVEISRPVLEKFGEYSCNIAFLIGQEKKKDPRQIAGFLKKRLEKNKTAQKIFSKIEIAGSGFLNFYLKKEFLQDALKEILRKGRNFGKINLGREKKVQVEFISANPTGPLTIGNARGGPFGDCLANVLKFANYKVEKAYYVNDCGKQIMELGKSLLGKGTKYQGEYIKEIGKKIKAKDFYRAGQQGARIILEKIIKPVVERLGIKYDEWFFESTLYKSSSIKKTINLLTKKGLTYRKDGAIWFKSKKFGDVRDRVLVKKDGTKTYLAGDIAYHRYKFEKKKFNKVINIWGADHYGDVAGLQAGMSALGHKGKLDIILLQFVTLIEEGKPVKMSKRRGRYITMEELLDEVGKDVVRFFFLEKSADKHLEFDLNLAREQSEKNPVYYVQYAYARICSILRRYKGVENFEPKSKELKLLTSPYELVLIKEILKFPEVIEEIVQGYQVQRLPKYALELASAFHQFYHHCQVLTSDDNLTRARVALILATKNTLENLFQLMGIDAPRKM
ncbi:arginine--tRNA ligase [bacterium]|nr:arginine--tRNA ligase [bacterium]